jgi:phosphoglycerol transferase MdoB-like AlkP superfamily enzyme
MSISPKKIQKFVTHLIKYYFLIVLLILIYIENATFPFITQYDVRPNYLFVEYLEYPKEVFSMLIADYKLALLIAFGMMGIFAYIFMKKLSNGLSSVFDVKYSTRILLLLPLLVLLFIGIRSSFGHRAANISDAMYSSNRMLNEITKNSLHSIIYAVYVNKKHGSEDLIKQYGKMNVEEAIKRVQSRLNIESIDKKFPLSRSVKSNFKTKEPKNIVIFLQESLGYQFVEATGGEAGITPHLNKLANEGILFKNLYSNGTRSIRGIAGSVAGNFSVPGKGVLKRNKSQKGFFTISSLLEPFGYHTMFLYGGESRFDNMKGWFSGNGFDEIIDQSKFENPSYVGTWGVCDEEVAQRANSEFKELHKKGKKFAAVMFSTSNHSPFDFPDGKIDLVDGVEKKSVKNAIKYADYSIGSFISSAKKESYWDDTVFVIVSDHNVRVYGDDMVPVEMFNVPGLILGGGIKPQIYNNVATQPDVLATALDLVGLDLTYPIMGNSIFSDKKQNISLMQFHNSYALRQDNKVAIIRPDKKPLTFIYENKHLKQTQPDEELQKDALAFVVVLDYMYNNKLYK